MVLVLLMINFPYFYEGTIFLEALLFSMALSSRLNKTKELEISVQKNDILTRELHHRIKNNMQFIISLYRLNLSEFINDTINEKLMNTENTIKAISRTHEILYNQNNLESLDMKNYFEQIIQELESSFRIDNIKIVYNINTNVDVSKSIICGIILNELITNAIKYAFPNRDGEIHISLEKTKNNQTRFVIEDNGIGLEDELHNLNGFGIVLISNLVRNELEGDIEFTTNKGTKIEILF